MVIDPFYDLKNVKKAFIDVSRKGKKYCGAFFAIINITSKILYAILSD
jgi:hypothetical protein